MRNTLHEQQVFSMTDLDTIFMRFSPQAIEEFYQLYQLWSLRQKREQVIAKLNELEQQITANEALFDAVSPSPIALATLSQFRAVGVDDLDLLDRMLERGDEWLDHTLQLFERCERLDMLQGNTTEWCTHALEGAYDWIESMDDSNGKSASDDNTLVSIPTTSTDQPSAEIEALPTPTEADFLQKLMSEDGENIELAHTIPHTVPDTQAYSEPTEDQTEELHPTESDTLSDIQEHSEPTEDQTTEPHPIGTPSDIQAYSAPTEDQTTEPQPHTLPEPQEHDAPIEDQTEELHPTESDIQAYSTSAADQTAELQPHTLPEPQEYSEPTADQTAEPQPHTLPEQIYPVAQPVTAPQPPANIAQKRASQIKRTRNISSKKQQARHKTRNINQYKRKQRRSR